MPFSEKQQEYLHKATHRWNVKTGATRSGKTFLDYFVIPKRIMNCTGAGLIVILGNTQSTVERNILSPMRQLWGPLVGNVNKSTGTVKMFGHKVYVLGADKSNQVHKIQGSGIEYCYGDEVTTWSEEVFAMLKSRLDKPNSCFDGTCNPDNPLHWFKTFLDSPADIYQQHYEIDDNPYLTKAFVESLKKEYSGTVYYDRYIKGLWTAAEGIIYRAFADNPDRYITEAGEHQITRAQIGVDFGGGSSAHAFCCLGYTRNLNQLVVLADYREKEALTPDQLARVFSDFVISCKMRWPVVDVFCDSAEQTLINGLRVVAARDRLGVNILNARKKPINDRIRALCMLMAADRFKICREAVNTRGALANAVWDSKHLTEDVRLDNGSTNIDSLDAMEYAFERDISSLVDRWR